MDKIFVIFLGILYANIVNCIQESPSVLYRSADEGVDLTEDFSREGLLSIETDDQDTKHLLRDGDGEGLKDELKTSEDVDESKEGIQVERNGDETVKDEERDATQIERSSNRRGISNLDSHDRSDNDGNNDSESLSKSSATEENTVLEEASDIMEATVHTKGRMGSPSDEIADVPVDNNNVRSSSNLKAVDNRNPIGRITSKFNPYNYLMSGNRPQHQATFPTPVPFPYSIQNRLGTQEAGNNQFQKNISKKDFEFYKDSRMEKYNPNSNAYPYEPLARTGRPLMETVTSLPFFKPLTYIPKIETATFPSPPKYDYKQMWPPLKSPFIKDNFYPDVVLANKFPQNYNPYNFNPFGMNRPFGQYILS